MLEIRWEFHLSKTVVHQRGLSNGIKQQVAVAMKIIVVDALAGAMWAAVRVISATHNLRSPPTELENKDMHCSLASFNLCVSSGGRRRYIELIQLASRAGLVARERTHAALVTAQANLSIRPSSLLVMQTGRIIAN